VKTNTWRGAAAGGLVALLSVAGTAHGQYLPGHSWNRFADWSAGTAPGHETNPGPDGTGNPVWHYEWTTGGALASDSAWYRTPGQAMTWDPVWWFTGFSAWSRGDNQSPPIHDRVMTHNLYIDEYSAIPVVRWETPVDHAAPFDVTGDLRVRWAGPDRVGSPVDVDVVVALVGGSLGTTAPLFTATVSKPTPIDSAMESVELPIELRGLVMQPGDSLLISMRGAHEFAPYGRWVDMFDNVTITLVPAPGGVLALATVGVWAGAGRRRR
jgi:hypothetical protein